MEHPAIDEQLAAARVAYQRDGAAVLRQVVAPEWIERLAHATDRLMSQRTGTDINRPGEGRFFAGFFASLKDPDYSAFVRESGLGALAGQLMGAKEVRFFYDQILVKEPGASKPTPWHQDLPYWPVTGEDIISIWVPVDPAGPENGVVTYVKGSHRWNAFFPQESWNEGAERGEPSGERLNPEKVTAPNGVTLADIRIHPERYEMLAWRLEPGDVLVHHPLTVHGAPGNLSVNQRRRAVATRWFGDDVLWHGERDNFMRRLSNVDPNFPYPEIAQGSRPTVPIFPLVWKM